MHHEASHPSTWDVGVNAPTPVIYPTPLPDFPDYANDSLSLSPPHADPDSGLSTPPRSRRRLFLQPLSGSYKRSGARASTWDAECIGASLLAIPRRPLKEVAEQEDKPGHVPLSMHPILPIFVSYAIPRTPVDVLFCFRPAVVSTLAASAGTQIPTEFYQLDS
ncbi:hypothetical protein K488DRAFT_84901 [Vararia minispora EC-137]|uniref:Uncharacterized protein n=1 Tax=Vararia minispora EC-137 TaxID=1314806 RepID=A0ACB8QP41_9AGAM|nr:hypothetical protein K488DRAFT_84901 [Vararia minispora EC-137]